MSKAAEYKSLFDIIRIYIQGDISKEEQNVLYEMLNALKYELEFSILKHCYDNSDSFNSLLPGIDSITSKLKEELSSISNKLKKGGQTELYDKRHFQAINMELENCEYIKKQIVDRNFIHYTQALRKRNESKESVARICASTLYDFDIDFMKEFMIHESEKSALDIIFDLKRNPQLVNELSSYFKMERRYEGDNLEALDKNKKYLEYLRIARNNYLVVYEYLTLLNKAGIKQSDEEIIIRDSLSRNRMNLEANKLSALGLLTNRKEIGILERQIQIDESRLAEINSAKEKLVNSREKMVQIGLGNLIEVFESFAPFEVRTAESEACEYIRLKMTKKGLDISLVENTVNSNINELEGKQRQKDANMKKHFNKLSLYGQELVSGYHDETKKMLEIVTSKDKDAINPVLASLILKALMESSNLSYQELNSILPTLSNEQITALEKQYNAVVRNTVSGIDNNIKETMARAPLDVSEIERPRIA